MRITFIISGSADSPYAQSRAIPLAYELTKQNHEITICALHHDIKYCESRKFIIDTPNSPINFIYAGQMHVIKRKGKKIYMSSLKLLWTLISSTLGLYFSAKKSKPDVIHIGKPQPMNGFAGYVLSRIKKIPLYVDCDDYEGEANRFSSKLQKKLVTNFEKWLPMKANGLTVNTTFLESMFINLGFPSNKIIKVPNGTYGFYMERNVEYKNSIIEEIKTKDQPIIAYVGTMALESHPIDILLTAFPIILSQVPDSILLLVGGGPDEDFLRKKVFEMGLNEYVVFTGQIDISIAHTIYKIATVTTDPVYNNPVAQARCPLKLMESMQSGCPIVTGNVGDRKIWLGNELSQLIAEPDSSESLAERIILIINEKKINKDFLSEKLINRSKAFSWTDLSLEWTKVYQLK